MTKTMIHPIGDRILVEQGERPELKSGLILSDEGDSKLLPEGTVLAVGLDVPANFDLKKGDAVFFNEYSGERVRYEEKTYLFLRPHEIIAKKV